MYCGSSPERHLLQKRARSSNLYPVSHSIVSESPDDTLANLQARYPARPSRNRTYISEIQIVYKK